MSGYVGAAPIAGGYTSTTAILVLYILLVIILQTF
ncbi:YjcZ family sporulation protein [Paenibacillus sp. P96]|uniref:YjcZ family sporulation protein n=1 Tax=Paenibacillus zeirhizosphaerae TaxID=2987519 RepID=A0ABT9FNM9_9BACL|nr:YjcZ family sporulation protein [Paenibacillus sp. P96]MDP4096336.1 YjcZ family sporulation protein [Paenibacillus sp. P96]